MPSRRGIVGIVVLWLTALGWLLYRELWQQAGQPPPFTVDLADEVGAQTAGWDVLCDKKPAGSARTSVRRTPQRLLEMQCQFSPNRWRTHGLTVKHLATVYRITPRGVLRELTASVTLTMFWGGEFKTEISGRSEGGFFTPLLRCGGDFPQAPVAVSPNGQVLNVLHPLHKMAELRSGQTWRTPLLNPLAVAAAGPPGDPSSIGIAEARVEAAALAWDGATVPCWRVAYHAEGDRLAARLWVRRSDGLVLRQEAHHDGTEIALVRRPTAGTGIDH
jgi:hypothetical protein